MAIFIKVHKVDNGREMLVNLDQIHHIYEFKYEHYEVPNKEHGLIHSYLRGIDSKMSIEVRERLEEIEAAVLRQTSIGFVLLLMRKLLSCLNVNKEKNEISKQVQKSTE